MSTELADLIKVMAVTLLIFAASTLAMLYIIALAATYFRGIPVLELIGQTRLSNVVPMLADTRVFATLLAVHVVATGFAMLLTSGTIDMALLILSKAATVVLSALLGYAGGYMGYLQLNTGTQFNLNALLPALVVLVIYLVLSTWLSVPSLRRLNHFRFPVGVLAILFGPLIMNLL